MFRKLFEPKFADWKEELDDIDKKPLKKRIKEREGRMARRNNERTRRTLENAAKQLQEYLRDNIRNAEIPMDPVPIGMELEFPEKKEKGRDEFISIDHPPYPFQQMKPIDITPNIGGEDWENFKIAYNGIVLPNAPKDGKNLKKYKIPKNGKIRVFKARRVPCSSRCSSRNSYTKNGMKNVEISL